MKKYISLFAILFLLSCDDGDMTFQTFNFANADPQVCSDRELLFKTNGTEALLLDVDFRYFSNSEKDTTYTLSANSIIYRNYSGPVSGSSVLCANIPPATPQVVEEWFSVQGAQLNVSSFPVTDENGILTGYSHVITIISAEFNQGDENAVFTNTSFGTYDTTLNYVFDFPSETVSKCTTNNVLYKRNLNEGLIIRLTPEDFAALFSNTTTDPENPEDYRSLVIDPNDNRVIFDVYSGNITDEVICGDVDPVTPTIEERWNAEGEIRVTTSYNSTTLQYEHSVKLIEAEFTNSLNIAETFTFDEYDLGVFTTSE